MPYANGVIPFTELVERAKDEDLRDKTMDTTAEDKYKAVVNDTYRLWIPAEFEFKAFQKTCSTPITTNAVYTTGTASINVGSSSLTGLNTVWTSAMTGRKIYIKSGHEVYDFTYGADTSATIDRNFIASADASGVSYVIFQRRYSLASDFWRPMDLGPERGSFYYYQNGGRVDLWPKWLEDWGKYDFSSPGTPAYFHIVCVSGVYYVEISPPDVDSRTIFYDYIPYLTPMTEYVTGTVAVTNGSATVTGTGTSLTSNVAAGDYFRVDGDGTGSSSRWYKILTVDNTTQLTLDENYIGTTQSGKNFTCSQAPSIPPVFHPLISMKVTIDRAADRNAKQVKVIASLLERYLGRLKSIDEGYNWDTELESIYRKYNYRR